MYKKLCIMFLILTSIVLGGFTKTSFAYSLDLGRGTTLSDVDYVNKNYVAVGNSGAIFTSSDGKEWSKKTSRLLDGNLSEYNLRKIIFANGKYIVLASKGFYEYILVSENLTDWQVTLSQEKVGQYISINDVIWGNNEYIAFGSTGIYSSPDGVTWVHKSIPYSSQDSIKSMVWQNNNYIGITDDNYYFSTNSLEQNWEKENKPVYNFDIKTSEPKKVLIAGENVLLIGNGTFISKDSGKTWIKSDNFKSWPYADGENTKVDAAAFGNNHYIGFYEIGKVLNSTDGLNWVSKSINNNQIINEVKYCNGKFIAVGINMILISDDGTNWVNIPYEVNKQKQESEAKKQKELAAKQRLDKIAAETKVAKPFIGKTYWIKINRFNTLASNFQNKVIDPKTKKYINLPYTDIFIKVKVNKFTYEYSPVNKNEYGYLQITINNKIYLVYEETITKAKAANYEILSKDPKKIFKWSASTWKKLKMYNYWIGMTRDMAIITMGKPTVINKTVTSRTVKEQWVYRHSNSRSTYLYFKNGMLTSWQN